MFFSVWCGFLNVVWSLLSSLPSLLQGRLLRLTWGQCRPLSDRSACALTSPGTHSTHKCQPPSPGRLPRRGAGGTESWLELPALPPFPSLPILGGAALALPLHASVSSSVQPGLQTLLPLGSLPQSPGTQLLRGPSGGGEGARPAPTPPPPLLPLPKRSPERRPDVRPQEGASGQQDRVARRAARGRRPSRLRQRRLHLQPSGRAKVP